MRSENHIGIRVDAAEKAALQQAADKARLPLSTWIKLICLTACDAMDFEDAMNAMEKARATHNASTQVFASRCPFCGEPAEAHAAGGRPGCPKPTE